MTTQVSQASFDDAIQFAIGNESTMNRDIGAALEQGHFEEPWPIGQTIGPVKERADPSGVILIGGEQIASWGDTQRVDMTFSISKSYLALCAGIAVQDGLIGDLDAPVSTDIDEAGFRSEHNAHITWRHLLQLTSEWEGTLWDKPDWIDHNRSVMGRSTEGAKGEKRVLRAPGTYWEYNDVRVNQLALALLHVFQRPLPEVLKERIMDPIGASDDWVWHGYDNSWVDLNGRKMQSVSGGAHWGGGLWISTNDHARIGLLMMKDGVWNGQQILPTGWVSACRTPCDLNAQYGLLWWLNTDCAMFPGASASSFFAIGVGTQFIWVDPDLDLVVVARWMDGDAISEFMRRVSEVVRNNRD